LIAYQAERNTEFRNTAISFTRVGIIGPGWQTRPGGDVSSTTSTPRPLRARETSEVTQKGWFAYAETGPDRSHRLKRFRLFRAVSLNAVGLAALAAAALPLALLLVFVVHQSWWLSVVVSLGVTLATAITLDRRKKDKLVHPDDSPGLTPAVNTAPLLRVLRLCTIERNAGTIRFLYAEMGHDRSVVDAEIARLRFIGLVKDLPSGRLITTAEGNQVIDATGKWEVVVSELKTSHWSGGRTIVIAESTFREPEAGDRFVSSRGASGTVMGHDFVTLKDGRLGLFLDIEVSPEDTLTAVPTIYAP
jgi:hypothetical protein